MSMDEKILLILTGEECANAEEAAFRYAKSNSKRLVVLHILTSHLYHYGHQDIIATRPSKRQFLLHIRDEVMERGKVKTKAMAEKAQGEGIVREHMGQRKGGLQAQEIEDQGKSRFFSVSMIFEDAESCKRAFKRLLSSPPDEVLPRFELDRLILEFVDVPLGE